jgi:uncharacterized membrane protein
MTEPPELLSAALLGVAGGMRSFVPLAALGLRGRLPGGPLRTVVLVASAGELVADKHPAMESRLRPMGLAGRLVGSGAGGYVLAGPAGAALGAAVAMATAQASARGRGALAGRLGSDLPAAFAEDGASAAIAALSTR